MLKLKDQASMKKKERETFSKHKGELRCKL